MLSVQQVVDGAAERSAGQFEALARGAGQPRPIPSRIPSPVEGIGTPLGPLPPSFARPLPGSTTRPHHGLRRDGEFGWSSPLGGQGLGRAERRAWRRRRDGRREGRGWPGWLELSPDVDGGVVGVEGDEGNGQEEACRRKQAGAPWRAWRRREDCSRRGRSRSGWATRSATSGGSGGRACCHGSRPGRKYVRFAVEDVEQFVHEGREPGRPASRGVPVSAPRTLPRRY